MHNFIVVHHSVIALILVQVYEPLHFLPVAQADYLGEALQIQ